MKHSTSRPLSTVGSMLFVSALLAACGSTTQMRDDASAGDSTANADSNISRDGNTMLDAITPIDALDAAPDADMPADADVGIDVPATTDSGTPQDSGGPVDSGPTPQPTSALLLDGTSPMPCADPTVFSQNGADNVFFAYCTSMSHVWRTSDWVNFSDQRSSTRFDLTGMSANGMEMGSWWAPGIVYAPDLSKYVMWVSVPAAGATRGTDGWDARALAVLIADSPTGPWIFRGMAQTAGAGEHYIDPFLFRDHDGRRYVFWKQYGGGIPSRIMGAAVDATWRTIVAGSRVEIMNGYGGPGTWEDNVRENPAVWYEATGDRYHLIFSGGHWAEDNYATGHALSTCGPLCVNGAGSYHMVDSGDRGILQVVRTFNSPDFAFGGPGGAEFQDRAARYIVYAAAARSARGDHTRFLMRDRVQWQNGAPFVDTAGHNPLGY